MRIQQLSILAGPAGVIQPGTIWETTDETGQALVDGGFALLIEVLAPEEESSTETEEPSTEETPPPAEDVQPDPEPEPTRRSRRN